MKCKLVRDAKQVNPAYNRKDDIKARHNRLPYNIPQFVDVPAGTEIRGPEAFRLVEMGMAEPSDDECRARCGMTDKQIADAVYAQDKVSKGIAPEDYKRYDRGEMLGYNPDGTDIKGPNWAQYNDLTEDDLFDEGDEDDGDDE